MSNNFKAHAFICTKCTYIKEDGSNCSESFAKGFRKSIKSMAKKKWDKCNVRINASGCLDECEKGIACVVYPSGTWLTSLKDGDEMKVMDLIQQEVESND